MRIELKTKNSVIEITTENSQSSHGAPVVVIDGQVAANVSMTYEPDVFFERSVLDRLADAAGVHDGPQTRNLLDRLADEMLADVEAPRGADYDRVIDEFLRQGREKFRAEMATE